MTTHCSAQLDLVVTTTGNIDVCDKHMLKALKKGAVVCNIGHFDNEIDTAFHAQELEVGRSEAASAQGIAARRTRDFLLLLSEGRLVNLGNATGHPSRIMDGSFSNQVLAQIYLYERKFADLEAALKPAEITVTVLPKKLDEEVAAHMVRGFGGVITDDQRTGEIHRRIG
jgi:adenosylhomocysteinase